jgi:hypothetical protein
MSNFSCTKQTMLALAEIQTQEQALVQTETLNAVLSGNNVLQARVDREASDGIAPLIAVKVMPNTCDEAEDCSPTDQECQKVGVKVPKVIYKTFEINDCLKSKQYEITESDYQSACDGKFGEAFQTALKLASVSMVKTLNKKAIAFMNAMATQNLGTINMTNADGTVNFSQAKKIGHFFTKNGLVGTPTIIGGETVHSVRSAYGLRNSETGASNALSGQFKFVYESHYDNTPSENHKAVAYMPDAITLLTYCKYGDQSQYEHTMKAGSAADLMSKYWSMSNVTGRTKGCLPLVIPSVDGNSNRTIWVDFVIFHDCDKFYLQLKCHYKFINTYTQLCNSTFNGIASFNICPIPELTCPTPIPPVVTPYVAKVLTFVEPCNPNEVIYSVKIGNATYTGEPMTWDGSNVKMVEIINAFYGSTIVAVSGLDIVTVAPFDATGIYATGSINSVIPFNFV